MTIAALAYDGISRRSYLRAQTIKYVEWPPWSNYSADSVLWMSYVMARDNIFIQHAENHGERRIELTRANGLPYLKKVDGYREYVDVVTGETINRWMSSMAVSTIPALTAMTQTHLLLWSVMCQFMTEKWYFMVRCMLQPYRFKHILRALVMFWEQCGNASSRRWRRSTTSRWQSL